MIAIKTGSFAQLRWPGWLAAPIFDKELRVASRRRRNYWLRFLYVFLLTAFLAMTWVPVATVPRWSIAVFLTQSEMVAKTITKGVIWFQFFGAQLVTVVMMSTAISDEVYGGTLSVLMTTPLSGTQVVMSKLVSRLLQILMLVATSLPLLAIVRVLGGVPWNCVLASFGITLATVVLVGSISVFFSALCRRAHVVVIASVLGTAGLFVLLPFLVFVVLRIPAWQWQTIKSLPCLNPYVLLDEWMDAMMSPRGGTTGLNRPLLYCCSLLFYGSMVLLKNSIRLVRHVALRRAMGEPALVDQWRSRFRRDTRADEAPPTGAIRRVVGPPMIWRELVCRLSRREKLAAMTAVGIEVMMLFIAFTFLAVVAVLGYEGAHALFILTFLTLAVFFTVNTSATLVSTEREARTWPLLLVTPLRDRDILAGKFAGLLRRCGPIWLPLVAYVVLFTGARIFHPLAIPHILAMSTSILFFLGCTGLYLSSRMRRTTAAVTAHLALIGGFWLILPVGVFVAANALDQADLILADPFDVMESVLAFVPFAQEFLHIGPLLEGDLSDFEWAGFDGALGFLLMVVVVAGTYVLAGLLFVARAVKAFRRTALEGCR